MSSSNPFVEDGSTELDGSDSGSLSSSDVSVPFIDGVTDSLDDEEDFLPDFTDEDFESFLFDDSARDSFNPSDFDNNGSDVNYDDYVALDVARGYREDDDGSDFRDEALLSVVLEGLSSKDDNVGSVSSDEDLIDDRSELLSLLNGGDDSDDDSDDYPSSPSSAGDSSYDAASSLDDVLSLGNDDVRALLEGIDSGDDDGEANNDYPRSASMFYSAASDEDDDGFVSSSLDIDAILSRAIDMGASDVDVIANDEITFTILGDIVRMPEFGVINSRQVLNVYMDITLSVAQEDFLRRPEMDTSYEIRSGRHMGRRLRLSVAKSFGNILLVFRVISNVIPDPADIGVDQRLLDWIMLPNGLVMLNGSTGQGKSTTLASLIRHRQLRSADKIITIEKPVEFVYGVAGKSSVTQREVGPDTASFFDGLDSAMRQHPDVILIGEVRNQSEVNSVLYAAETGHLALTTMHTNSAAHTLNRIKRLFKGDEQLRVLGDLSEELRGLANQVLVLSPDGNSRSAVHEILEVDDTVREFIADGDVRSITKYQEELGATMEHGLVRAVKEGRCTIAETKRVSSNHQRLNKILLDEGLV